MKQTSKRSYIRPLDLKDGIVELSYGSGGRNMVQLIDELFAAAFDNPLLNQRNDQACFGVESGRMVMTTDSYVVSPLFFPGGNIGSLAIHGTINDVAMAGAEPLYLSTGFIIEEGFPLADLNRVVQSMSQAAEEANVPIVTGDTKVVDKGKADGLFINTTGVGVVPDGVNISADQARPGDKVLLSGTIGDHGVAVMSKRENLDFDTIIESDSAALNELVEVMIQTVPGIHVMRDPTRGGLASTLNEITTQSDVGIVLDETAIPVRKEVEAACEILGLDPLHVANEGKLVAICHEADAEKLLAVMKSHPLGKDSAIIGEVVEDPDHFVEMKTTFGGRRIVDWLSGEQLPRIC